MQPTSRDKAHTRGIDQSRRVVDRSRMDPEATRQEWQTTAWLSH